MKRLFLYLLCFLVFISLGNQVFSDTRFASCDLCGLCQTDGSIQSQPSNWESCRSCIYPGASKTASDMDTLKIDSSSNLAPTPVAGHQFTMIGCIQTNLQSFAQEGSAASVVQLLLNVLFGVIGAIALLYLIYGSFVVLTSQADPERLNYGKRLAVGALVGVTFTLLSAFIVNFLASGVLKIPGF